MATTEDNVAAAAQIMADVEDAAKIARDKLRELKALFTDIHNNGSAGLLLTKSLAKKADALGTQFEADVWALHREMTLAAQDLGIDLPTIESGGGR